MSRPTRYSTRVLDAFTKTLKDGIPVTTESARHLARELKEARELLAQAGVALDAFNPVAVNIEEFLGEDALEDCPSCPGWHRGLRPGRDCQVCEGTGRVPAWKATEIEGER